MDPAITAARVRRVALGMSHEEVARLLGAARQTNYSEVVGTDKSLRRLATLVYSQPVRSAFGYPMLWIHLEDGKVRGVCAKHYYLWGADDTTLYSLDIGHRSWGAPYFAEYFDP